MRKVRKVFFRADADATIGYGHFVRSLALADMLKDDFDCTFFTQAPSRYQEEEVCKVCRLVSLPADDRKFQLFLDQLDGDEIVFLDNYFFTSAYEKEIKAKGCKLVNIDSGKRDYCCDLLIGFLAHPYDAYDLPHYTKAYSGIEWFILREPFRERRAEAERDESGVVIAFGGTDQFGFTEQVVSKLSSAYPHLSLALIATSAFPAERLSSLERQGVDIHKDIPASEVARLFATAGYAIVSASTISVEALSQGCKVIAGHYMPDQVSFYKYLVREKLINGVGDLRDKAFVDNLDGVLKGQACNGGKIDFSNQRRKYIDLFKQLG